ncbi:hypothetical protein L6255_00215 [Candidatus Parcubacteria bacterium]|nr:hypothetical protein [Patescibacteria group bacterium]MBU4381372.1 hypothetical protein [Patescibacteria group bacterium]MCG2688864.1 hypothetical protein [Candidatus Parcubacteria bacterium]
MAKAVVLPKSLLECWNKGVILCVVQFGSSLYPKTPNDLDIAIVTKKGKFWQFLDTIKSDDFSKIDVSLIREEEIGDWKNFKFGSYGVHHVLLAIKCGKALIGENVFKNFPYPNKEKVRESVKERMEGYVYIARKSMFTKELRKEVRERWEKFLVLSLYLLSDKFELTDVFKLSEAEATKLLEEKGINFSGKDIIKSYEILWEKISQSYDST